MTTHLDRMSINPEKVVVKMLRKKRSEFDEFVDKLQKQIDNEDRIIFSQNVIEEYQNPYHFGIMKNASAKGKIKGWCGDTMQIFIKIEKNRIIDASFFTDGCGATMACGSMIIKLIQNKLIDNVIKITEEDLKNALNGLPQDNEHCAELTIKTLKATLENYRKK